MFAIASNTRSSGHLGRTIWGNFLARPPSLKLQIQSNGSQGSDSETLLKSVVSPRNRACCGNTSLQCGRQVVNPTPAVETTRPNRSGPTKQTVPTWGTDFDTKLCGKVAGRAARPKESTRAHTGLQTYFRAVWTEANGKLGKAKAQDTTTVGDKSGPQKVGSQPMGPAIVADCVDVLGRRGRCKSNNSLPGPQSPSRQLHKQRKISPHLRSALP